MLYQLSYRRLATCIGQVASGNCYVHLEAVPACSLLAIREHSPARSCVKRARAYRVGPAAGFARNIFGSTLAVTDEAHITKRCSRLSSNASLA